MATTQKVINQILKQKAFKNFKILRKDVIKYCTLLNQGLNKIDAINKVYPNYIIETPEEYDAVIYRLEKSVFFQEFQKKSDIQAINKAKNYFEITKNDHVANLIDLKEKALLKATKDNSVNALRLAFNIENKIGESLGFYNHDIRHTHQHNMSFKDMINEIEQPKQIQGEVIEAEPQEVDEIDTLPLIEGTHEYDYE